MTRLVGDIDHLPDFISDQLVATVTEGLSNVVRHAQASSATVHIEHRRDRLSLSIADDVPAFERKVRGGARLEGALRAARDHCAVATRPHAPSR